MGFDAATVSELVSRVKDLLENEFGEVMVQGEVTNLSPSSAGHWYFTLSDEDACLSCALFKGDALRNPLIRTLKNGDKIVVAGPISVYQKRGSFQLLAKRIFPAGEGQLKIQYERLKAKLAQEGLFDLEKKNPIPPFPKRIAVITAQHGAALQDFLNVLGRRSLWMDVIIVPAIVQGDAAPKSLLSALASALKVPGVETIVFTRGGGSLEDLWAFNDEKLVRAIHSCQIPVVSAIGHQVDFTLCDYVSDLRSETPTAAAETLSQPQTELKARLVYCQTHLRSDLFKLKQSIQLMSERFHPKGLSGLLWRKIQTAEKKLSEVRLKDRASELIGTREATQRLDENFTRLTHGTAMKSQALGERLKRLDQVLSALNPTKVLGRGYTILQNPAGEVISSLIQYEKMNHGARLGVRFHDGKGNALKD